MNPGKSFFILSLGILTNRNVALGGCYHPSDTQPQESSVYDFCSNSWKINEAWQSAFALILSAV